jgi:hypothetical protein
LSRILSLKNGESQCFLPTQHAQNSRKLGNTEVTSAAYKNIVDLLDDISGTETRVFGTGIREHSHNLDTAFPAVQIRNLEPNE